MEHNVMAKPGPALNVLERLTAMSVLTALFVMFLTLAVTTSAQGQIEARLEYLRDQTG